MTEVVRLFRTTAFDDAMVQRLCDAYDRVIRCLQDIGQGDIAPEIVAQRVISLAKQGISDSRTLCVLTLRATNKERRPATVARRDTVPTDIEFIWYAQASARQSTEKILDSLALVKDSQALIARIEHQLNGSRFTTGGPQK